MASGPPPIGAKDGSARSHSLPQGAVALFYPAAASATEPLARPPTASSQDSVQQMQLRILALAAALLCGASVTNGGSDDSTTCSR